MDNKLALLKKGILVMEINLNINFQMSLPKALNTVKSLYLQSLFILINLKRSILSTLYYKELNLIGENNYKIIILWYTYICYRR